MCQCFVRTSWRIREKLYRCSFYPRSPEVEPWVFRWTFSSPPSSPSSHLQLIGTGVQVPARGVGVVVGEGVGGFWGGYSTVDHGSCAEYVLLFNLVFRHYDKIKVIVLLMVCTTPSYIFGSTTFLV